MLIDRTLHVVKDSIKIENILTNRRDTAEFLIMNNTGYTFKPNIGSEVVIMNGSDKIFGGVIISIESVSGIYAMVQNRVICQDYTRLLDHKLVVNTFTNQTVNEIISFLKDNYFPTGFTINNVDANIMVDYVGFNYKPLAECIKMLANLINYDWYVDYDKDLHFFAKESVDAPFDLSDTNGKYYYDSLIIRRDNTQIRNSIIVRGGEYIGSQLTTEIETNGVDDIYPLPYKFSDFAASLTGTTMDIGIDYLDDADDFDALHNFKEKILRFKPEDTPTIGNTLVISGKPHLPVILRYRSEAHVQAMISAEGGDGVYEYLIKDESINSREGALQRAQGEIMAYGETLSEGEFVTEESGLRAGMAITIQSDSRNINERMYINKVTIVQHTKNTFLYRVSLITTRTMDLIDVLQKLLLQSTDDLKLDPNEITDVYLALSDEGGFTDTLGTFSTHGTAYRWGPSSNQGKWDQMTWS